MAELASGFETGVDGNDVLTTDTGDPDAWIGRSMGAGSSLQYDTTHVHGGSLAAKYVSTGALGWLAWQQANNDHYGRIYIYLTAHPAGSFPFYQTDNSGRTARLDITGNPTPGHIRMIDGPASGQQDGSVQIALNQWVRVEWHIVHSATVGQIEVKLFNTPESTTPSETITGPASWNTGTGAYYLFGNPAAGGAFTYWFDDVVEGATDWVGPIAGPPQTLHPSADSVDGAWTDQAGGTSLSAAIDEITFDDADYIRSELNPSASGCRVKLAAGGDPHLSTDHQIHWRTGKIGSATINMTVKLYQGGGNSQGAGTLIATFNRNNVGALTTYDETLSGGEADSITDYTDLYLEFFANTA